MLDVVVVNYHSGDTLIRSLRVARSFAGPEADLVVVDNSPEDGVGTAARTSFPDVQVIENEANLGFAAAANQGIRAGRAPLVLLLNPDVSSIEGDLETVEGIFAADPRVAALGVLLRNEDGSVQPSARREPRPLDLLADALSLRTRFPRWSWPRRAFYADAPETRTVDTVFGACLFVRRTALEDVGPFDERFFVYAEETDWLVRAKRRGWKTVLTPDVMAIHTLRGSTDASAETLSLLLLESNYAYAAKHFGAATALTLRIGVAGIDSGRWLRALLLGKAKREHRRELQRRLAVHAGASGRSPRLPGRRS